MELKTFQVGYLIASKFPKEVIKLIDQSKKSIYIVVYAWYWYKHDVAASVQLFNQSIVRAQRRGVDVKAIVNFPSVVPFLQNNGIKVKKLQSKKLLHTKMMIIDEKTAVVGSHNYSQHAFTRNLELSCVIKSDEPLDELLGYFKNLWQL